MLKVAAASYSAGASLPSMGRFGVPDLITTIEWYRQFTPAPVAAQLAAEPAGDPVAFTERYAFRPLGGGYIASFDDQVYHFPLAMIDLQSSLARTLLLNVPYEGEVIDPLAGIRGWSEPYKAEGPYLLGVTWLEISGATLRVVVATEYSVTAVDFEVGGIMEGEK